MHYCERHGVRDGDHKLGCAVCLVEQQNRVAELEALVRAQAELLVCYRCGRRPPERLLSELAKHRSLFESAMSRGGSKRSGARRRCS